MLIIVMTFRYKNGELQELTRRGMKESEMKDVAQLIKKELLWMMKMLKMMLKNL